MRLERIKPISYFKANAAEIIRDLADVREPMIITQNGEATAVIQDIHSYQATQETLALLKLLAIGREEIGAGKTRPVLEALDAIKSDLLSRR